MTTPDLAGLCERLREQKIIDAFSTPLGPVKKVSTNPDGPEAAAAIESLVDRNEGLTEDLYQAVLVAYQRGATEWARLNYPQWIEAIEAGQQVAPIARTALEGASDDR